MTLKMKRDDEVLLVTGIGAVTLQGLLLERAAIAAEWRARQVRATVFDSRGSEFRLSPHAWDLAFEAGVRWAFREATPMAVVVAPADLPFFERQAAQWAQHGIVRATFTDLSRAVEWAGSRRRPGRRQASA